MNLEGWVDDMATQPLPGGIAAAATAATMGAALVAKTGRITLRRVPMDGPRKASLRAAVETADDARADLLGLAGADLLAYHGWLESRQLHVESPLRQRALAQTTEIPLRIVEVCQAVLRDSQPLLSTCWPAARADLEIGRWLLETGIQAGSLVAEENRKHAEMA